MYTRQTETAIAAASRLAEVWDDGKTRLSVTEIAESRNLQRPFLAKILTVLSQAGIVSGIPGPGGGFMLARPPREIRIYDIYRLFETENVSHTCPFGGGICGQGEPCPLHSELVDVQHAVDQLLYETTLERFVGVEASPSDGTDDESTPASRRRSFRASTGRLSR
ncbi:MAG: Rrf2 family transcriptional regulator [Planctomycetes bacterium]|nr:Rrf2 family transcriptional regulator [Phycisphaeraceae bacterium]MCP3902420.1 Rrf2 family transcriptional regulator [Planctomycetota bacterium]MCP4066656.1 Rrf2 family transcriptional regulator [Phycisphaeraceae bacterium]MCP4495991.1 Rrf2 family transcriptional regulator [Phycisphaeraceae bacterium]MCP4794668.1 Rrf2 family transcriptional regulator [Phycisphaeraceae bacterium]